VSVDFYRDVGPPEGYEFRVFRCCTDAGEGECPYTYVAPVRIGADRDAGGPLDWCPFCGEEGNLLGRGEVRVLDPSSEKWAQVKVVAP
jgi:hypothetical protein